MHFGPDRIGPRGLALLVVATLFGAILGIRGFSSPNLLPSSSAFAPSGAASSPAPSSSHVSPTPSSHHAAAPSPPPSPGPTGARHAQATAQPTQATSSAHPKLGPLLSSSQYASFAYRIYPSPMSNSAQSALAGFQISFKHEGSRVSMAVVTQGTSQPPAHQTYAASDKVYFIEASFGDDSGAQEFNLGDDGVIATNAQGRIIAG